MQLKQQGPKALRISHLYRIVKHQARLTSTTPRMCSCISDKHQFQRVSVQLKLQGANALRISHPYLILKQVCLTSTIPCASSCISETRHPQRVPAQLKRQGAKALRVSYPCVILNAMVAAHNTNDQYQDLVDPATRLYATSSQMSIEFEVDGPYKASTLTWPPSVFLFAFVVTNS